MKKYYKSLLLGVSIMSCISFLKAGNLALTATSWQVSSSVNTSQNGDKAIDGNIQTKWASNGVSSNSWLALDLGNNCNITSFVVKHASSNGESTTFNTQAFTVETGTSISGPWTTVATGNNAGQASSTTLTVNATTRFVRLNITDAGIDNHARIPEFEVNGTIAPTATNIAPNSTAWKASSFYGTNEAGNKAYDKSNTTKWTSDGSSATSWLALDLGANYSITSFVVKHASTGGEPTYLNTKNFQIQIGTSIDGPWTTKLTIDNSGQAASNTASLAATTTRYVRLYITNAGVDNYARIPEFEVYGTFVSGGGPNTDPKGFVDESTCTVIRGWAYDPDNSSASIDVHIYIDGAYAASVNTNQLRSDVNSAFGINGNHGYTWNVTSAYKNTLAHNVEVYAINVPSGNNPSIGKKSFGPCTTAPPAPANLSVTVPTCANPNATFNWSNSGSGWVVDISTNSNFSTFFNKAVPNLTTTSGPTGFKEAVPATGNALTFVPGVTYYWRVWNGSVHVTGQSFVIPNCGTGGANCSNLYGVHFWEEDANNIMNGKKGWAVECVNTDDGDNGGWGINNMKNIVGKMRSQGAFEPIIRINKKWSGTIPGNAAEFDDFANKCANIAAQLAQAPYFVKWFIVGNEINLAAENELQNGKGIAADHYAACFKKCYSKMKAAVPNSKVLVAGLGPFNMQGPLTSATGAGVYYDVYFERVVTQIGASQDGYATHAYGSHGASADNNLQTAYRNSNAWEFDCFKVFMAILKKYSYAKSQPVHITETNTNSHGVLPNTSYTSGWMQQAYQKINDWNKVTGNQQIYSLCWFVYKDYGGWSDYCLKNPKGNMGQGRTDFNSLTASTNYKPITCANMISTGIEDMHELSSTKLFPNPANDNINLSIASLDEDASINIYNMLGEKVYELNNSVLHADEIINLPVSQLKEGMYIVTINGTNTNYSSRFVVRH